MWGSECQLLCTLISTLDQVTGTLFCRFLPSSFQTPMIIVIEHNCRLSPVNVCICTAAQSICVAKSLCSYSMLYVAPATCCMQAVYTLGIWVVLVGNLAKLCE